MPVVVDEIKSLFSKTAHKQIQYSLKVCVCDITTAEYFELLLMIIRL